MKLYHGSTSIVNHPQILISERYLDFGYGFYTTLASFRLLEFKEPNRDWLEFIINNRRGKEMHDYDWVKGAVANDTLYQTLSLYESGILSVEETVIRLKVHHLFDQVSFHSGHLLKELHFVEAKQL
jgi:hypothetical protein